MWIFAYGSLIFRPSFAYVERRRAFLPGYVRRFWQGSPDHRGTPEAPGRVVTLIPDATGICGGCAYRIEPAHTDSVLAGLDAREQAGFERKLLPVYNERNDLAAPFAHAIVYVASESNQHFLGPLDDQEIALWIHGRHGPSGANADYVMRLDEALRELNIDDEHVSAIAAWLSSYGPHRG
jgi:cation transport regulator ChaC